MNIMQVSEVSLDEMWKVMEEFGVKRDLVEKINPGREQIEEVYMLIKQAKNIRRINEDRP
jgi:signal recognition particle subunit SEC65